MNIGNNSRPELFLRWVFSFPFAVPLNILQYALSYTQKWEGYVSPILRTMTGHQAMRQHACQTSNVSHFMYFDLPSEYVTQLVPFYVLYWTLWIHQLFV